MSLIFSQSTENMTSVRDRLAKFKPLYMFRMRNGNETATTRLKWFGISAQHFPELTSFSNYIHVTYSGVFREYVLIGMPF